MNTSKTFLVIYAIAGKILSIIGYIIAIFFLLGFFISVGDGSIAGIIISLVLLPIGILMIIIGSSIKREIKRFKKYVQLISVYHITSIDKIAVNTSQTINYVTVDIQRMINRKLFRDAYIDTKNNAIVINNMPIPNVQQYIESENINCTGCGAANSRQKGIVKACEYCGTSLK